MISVEPVSFFQYLPMVDRYIILLMILFPSRNKADQTKQMVSEAISTIGSAEEFEYNVIDLDAW